MSHFEMAMLTGDDLVTGEAVALELPAAGLGLRMVSGLIDLVVTLIAFFVVSFVALTAALHTDQALEKVALILIVVVVLLGIPVTVETLSRGKTLGKLAMGLRTVRDDAGPITFQHALIRAMVGVVEIYLLSGVPAMLSAMVSARGKRLGDYAAGTYVVRERVRLALPPPPMMPPPLAGWAAAADMAALPTGLALAVRQYLGRVPSLDAASRATVGGRLAQQVGVHVSPPPPPGTPPEAFLAAVIASRRERDRMRLAREAGQRARLTRR